MITLSDCTAATLQGAHHHALTFDFPMFSKPMYAEEFLELLATAASTAAKSGAPH